MDFRASTNFLTLAMKLHVFVHFPLGERVCIFDRILKGDQIGYSYETVTIRQEVSCWREYAVGVQKRE